MRLIAIDEIEQKTLKNIIEQTIAWSEIPLYKHECNALKNLLEKLNQGGQTA